MNRDNQRLIIVLSYVMMFMFYLSSLVFYVMPKLIADPTAGGIYSTLGLGALLGWFMKQLGDMGQFYVRKGTTPKSENASDKPE